MYVGCRGCEGRAVFGSRAFPGVSVQHRAEQARLVEIAGDGLLQVLHDIGAGVGDMLAELSLLPSCLEHGAHDVEHPVGRSRSIRARGEVVEHRSLHPSRPREGTLSRKHLSFPSQSVYSLAFGLLAVIVFKPSRGFLLLLAMIRLPLPASRHRDADDPGDAARRPAGVFIGKVGVVCDRTGVGMAQQRPHGVERRIDTRPCPSYSSNPNPHDKGPYVGPSVEYKSPHTAQGSSPRRGE